MHRADRLVNNASLGAQLRKQRKQGHPKQEPMKSKQQQHKTTRDIQELAVITATAERERHALTRIILHQRSLQYQYFNKK